MSTSKRGGHQEEGITRVNAAQRRYSAAFKARVLRECAQPDASVAGTALAHGINVNLVHTWRRKASRDQSVGVASSATRGFIRVAMQRPLQASPEPGIGAGSRQTEPIQISVQRGAVRYARSARRYPAQHEKEGGNSTTRVAIYARYSCDLA